MLVRQLVDEHDPQYGVGSMTCSVYDTAWVSMISKSLDGSTKWLFPSAFEYLLKTQHHDGGWHSSSSDIDGILNTLAALLALCKHSAAPLQIQSPAQDDLKHRQDRAAYYLEAKLSHWDISATFSDGFEILVPKLLDLLSAEGCEFHFPGLNLLLDLGDTASQRVNPALLYATTRSSTAKLIEGLIGELDFDRVSHHKISGSIMASPASTAAYLIYSSTWDNEAEAYLDHILSAGDERSIGAVPAQYPTTVFEVTQALSILLASGFSQEELGPSHLENAAAFLEACLSTDAGVTGSAPYIESDADSTARAITALCKLGRTPSAQGLVVRFEARDFFKTSTQDRNPTFRTNCLVLKAMLDLLPGNNEQVAQINKTVRFIANYWWTTNGQIADQTNTATTYSKMLMVDAFARLIGLWERGFAPVLDDLTLRNKVFICLYQALTRTLQDQSANGSWGRSQRCETTAYGVLTLISLAPLTSAPRVKAHLTQSIEKARKYLADNFKPLADPDHVWQGKTTAGSSILFQSYILAALQTTVFYTGTTTSIENHFQISLARIAIQTKYHARQSHFRKTPEWQIQACLVESQLFLPQLNEVKYAVFPQSHLQDDQHFDIIPFTWLAASNIERRYVGPEFLYQMMIVSFLLTQLDDYLTHYIAEAFAGCLFEVEDIVQEVFDDLEQRAAKDQCYCDDHENSAQRSSTATSGTASLTQARSVLYRLVNHILNHPYILMASYHDQSHLRDELLAFIIAQIGRLADASDEASREGNGGESPHASDQTYHAFSLSFLACLVGNQSTLSGVALRRDFLETPEQQYLAAAMCRHLSIVSFMSSTRPDSLGRERSYAKTINARNSSFGTYRSYSRSISSASSCSSNYSDGEISPVSSISSTSSAPSTSPISLESPGSVKASHASVTSEPEQLTRLLSHERLCLNVCLQGLDSAGISQCTADILGLFVDQSKLADQILRDENIGSCYQPTTAIEVIEQACILQPAPLPPSKAPGRGSVAQARAALVIEPLNPQRDPSASSSSSCKRDPPVRSQSPDSIKLTGASDVQRGFNLQRSAAASLSPRRTSRTCTEMSRIERIMSDMGDSNLPPRSHRSGHSMPKPKVNPMLRDYRHHRPRAATTSPEIGGQSLYAVPVTDAQKKAKSATLQKRMTSPTPVDAETIKLAKARMQMQRKASSDASAEKTKERKAREKAEYEAARERANCLQTKAMEQASRAPSLTIKDEVPLVRTQKSQRHLKKKGSNDIESDLKADALDEKGWVKAPPAVPVSKTAGAGQLASNEEGELVQGKKLRASRLVLRHVLLLIPTQSSKTIKKAYQCREGGPSSAQEKHAREEIHANTARLPTTNTSQCVHKSASIPSATTTTMTSASPDPACKIAETDNLVTHDIPIVHLPQKDTRQQFKPPVEESAHHHLRTAGALLTDDPTLPTTLVHLHRAIALAAHDHNIPPALASAATEAGNRVCAAGRAEQLMDIAERVDLVGLCRLPFLMGVVARFWEEVCGIVLAGEGEGGVNGRGEVEGAVVGELVWRFKREVEDQIEENVGTRAFEGDDEESDADDGEDGSGAHPEDHTGDDEGDDDGSDFCSNPFAEEGDQDTARPTWFWTTIAAPGEDHHALFDRAMEEVNERITIIEHVIGRAIRSVATKCDGSPATHFYTFYIPATRSILTDLAEEVTREIIKARKKSAQREATVPDPTSLDPLRFYFLRRIFLGDHPELASAMEDSMLDKEHRRDTMHVFWQNAVIDQTLSEEELEELCERLCEKETFDEMSEYIPTLQLDQSHTEFLNPTINRIMIATQDLRPPAPLIPGQSFLEDHGFQVKKVSKTPGQSRMAAKASARDIVADEILNLCDKAGLNDRTPSQQATKDLLGKMSAQTFATIMDEAVKPISGQAMTQSEVFIDGIFYAWTKGLISLRALHSLKGEGGLRDFLIDCAEQMSRQVLDLGDAPISMHEYFEMRNRGAPGKFPGDKTGKKSKKQERLTKVEGLTEILVEKPVGVSEKPESGSALPSTARLKDWKSSTVMELDLLDLLIGLILRALGSNIQEILKTHDEAMKRKGGTGEGTTVTADKDEGYSNEEVARISNLMDTLTGYVRQYTVGQVNEGAMMATHAEMRAILEKMLAGPNKAGVVRALARSDLLRFSKVKTAEEIVAYFVSPDPQSNRAGVKAVSNPLNKVAIPKTPIVKLPMAPEKRVQDATNEQDGLLLEIRDLFREYHAAGLGFEQDSTMGLATERPLSFLEDFRKARSKHFAQKLADGRVRKKQQKNENLAKKIKDVTKEEVAAHNHNKSELTRRMLKITQNMLPYFSTKQFNTQDLSKHLMDSIETLPCDDMQTVCTIIDQHMPKALKDGGKPTLASIRACADEFDAMMEKVCSVVMPCKCKCKHDHGQFKGKHWKNSRR
ncbi:MAG: hypothetical protein OHK93_003883 [Ramalina farinacea]|uniref:Uncharacterized protein n=1 Tax=Ramalina farinacea TaxID=258253 RepID=A0AA43QHD6_9LECA|nr:hypothetical protein [Ramalina farinacea]